MSGHRIPPWSRWAAALRRCWRRLAGFLSTRLRFSGWDLPPEPLLPRGDEGAPFAARLREPAPDLPVPPGLAAFAAELAALDSARASAAVSRSLAVDAVAGGYLLGFREESLAVARAALGRAAQAGVPTAAKRAADEADEAIVFRVPCSALRERGAGGRIHHLTRPAGTA